MALPDRLRLSGLEARNMPGRRGYEVEGRPFRTCAEVDAFKAAHGVATTPQAWMGGERTGGHDGLRARRAGRDSKARTTRPAIALFAVAAGTALAISAGLPGGVGGVTQGHFVGVSKILPGMRKLRDVEGFSPMVLDDDALARRWVPYADVRPWCGTGEGVLTTGMLLTWLAARAALVISTIGAWSAFKAVSLDQRDLRCARVGGGSNVPLGFASLTGNPMMMAMPFVMLAGLAP